MSTDRKSLLETWSNARFAASNQFLPPEIRAGYKTAADQAEVVLGLLDAIARAKPPAPAA